MNEIDDVAENHERHTEDIEEIISAVPSWTLRWGISLLLGSILLIIGLSAFIRYPETVKATIIMYSSNSPKPVVAKIGGKLTKILVTENELVQKGQAIGFIESTGDPNKILKLSNNLDIIQQEAINDKPIEKKLLDIDKTSQLGEIQAGYQTFYSEYITYLSTINNGYLLQKKEYLTKDLEYLNNQLGQLLLQKNIQQKDSSLAYQDVTVNRRLFKLKVETQSEIRMQESKYLAKITPLIATEQSIISNKDALVSKKKDILEVDNEILEEKQKFLQALNSLISLIEDWQNKYILSASETGRISSIGIVQENQVLAVNQEVFYVNPGKEDFFGQMDIGQSNVGKVRVGQKVNIKLRGYPYEEYGMLHGTIQRISDVPFKDSVFISKVLIPNHTVSDFKKPVRLKQGMVADAEIITENASLLQRLVWSLLKLQH